MKARDYNLFISIKSETIISLKTYPYQSIDEMKKSRYVKPDKPRFYDIEVSAHDIFSHQTGSRVGFSSRVSSAV